MPVEALHDESLEYPYLYTKKGEVPFWDHPQMYGYKFLPKDYRPVATIEAVLSLYARKRIDETDIMILKVLGDAICCNEDQLRRYFSTKLTSSQVSKRLDKLRKMAFVERWKVRVRTDEEYKPPAPFVLGIAGYKLLKHYYNQDFFMDPNRWDSLGIGAVQRYVAVNEFRCRLIEARAASSWKWNALIADNKLIKKPMGVAEIVTPKGNINFLIDRPQMNQNYIGYLKDKLHNWKKVYQKYGNKLPISDFAENVPTVIIFASTISMAKQIHKEVMLDTFPYIVWFCIEEDMTVDGLDKAFYRPVKEDLQRFTLDFLKKLEPKEPVGTP